MTFPTEDLPYFAQSAVINLELTRPAEGSLGFSLIQAEKGQTCALLVKCLSPGGTAMQDGRLRVGDRLLQVHHLCAENLFAVNLMKAIIFVK